MVNVTDALFHHAWDAFHGLTFEAAHKAFEEAVAKATLGLDRQDLFRRLQERPKVRSFMLFGQTTVDDGANIQLVSAATWPTALPDAGPDQGERAFIVQLNQAARNLTSLQAKQVEP